MTAEEGQTIYDRAFALADLAWNHGFRYDAAELALSMSRGATSGEILPELFWELQRQRKMRWASDLERDSEIVEILDLIRNAYEAIGQTPPG